MLNLKKFFMKAKIKGNIKPNGEKIYHLPDGRFYDKVKAEVMFKTEEDAQKAGFVKSKR